MVEIREVSKTFGALTAVNGVTLSVPDNCIYGLLGTNGAGKSTLLRILAGILQPDGGSILVDGESSRKTKQSRQKIFFLPDEQYYFANATPESMAGFYGTMYSSFQTERFLELLQLFHLEKSARMNIFSKGMKKQVFLLIGLCAGTEYLLCDEVFDGLDPVIRVSIKRVLDAERKRRALIS